MSGSPSTAEPVLKGEDQPRHENAETPARADETASGGHARSGAIDAVRVAGILAVIAGHTLGTPLVRPLLYTWHVPLFFILAGFFWAPHRPFAVELRKRSRTLLLPYGVWFVLIAIPFLTLDPLLESTTWQRLLLPFWNGQRSAMPYTTFWFIGVLFMCCLLLRLLWRAPRYVVWAVAVLAAAAGWLFGPQLAETPFSIGSALPCLIYLMLGWAFRRLHDRMITPQRLTRAVLISLGALAVVAGSVVSGVSRPVDIKQGDYGTPALSTISAVVIACTLVLVAEWVFTRLPRRASLVATVLACGGFMVVLVHPVVLWVMQHFVPPTPDWFVFAICALVPWTAALIVVRTPFAGWLSGTPRLRAVSGEYRATTSLPAERGRTAPNVI
ncbi:acyltransferase family protein [Humibacter antri]